MRQALLAAAALAALELLRRAYARRVKHGAGRLLVAVSGTIQDGFELRPNIDWRGDGTCVHALFVGYGVARGAKMYLDVKDVDTSREYDPHTPHRVNPAMVLTGDPLDANQYAVYLVDERACVNALLGEPRLLTMAPDALRIDLDDPHTSPSLRSIARQMITEEGKSNMTTCAVLSVVACYTPRHFVPAPPVEIRPDGTRLTSFRPSLAAFAGLAPPANAGTIVPPPPAADTRAAPPLPPPAAGPPPVAAPGSQKWNQAVSSALAAHREAIAASSGSRTASDDSTAVGRTRVTIISTARIRRLHDSRAE